jgi:isopentenyl-diphosphate delta-isomerase
MSDKPEVPDGTPSISQRKQDHLDLCAGDEVGFRAKTTLFEEVELVHCALPDLALAEVDTSVTLLGHRLSAPIVIAAMTGGTDEAAALNRDLAGVAQELGVAIGLGSQRAMFTRPQTAWTYQVRDAAPDVVLFGNIGLVQARAMSTTDLRGLVDGVGANALCVHLNPAMELVQPGGDRDFSGGVDTFRRLVAELGVPVVAKETGSGLSRDVILRLRDAGVAAFDTSGAGGTSWVAVEAHRAEPEARALAEELWDWGIPTAASVLQFRGLGVEVIATGGMRTATDVVKALTLGATVGGLAAPILKAHRRGGRAEVHRVLSSLVATIRALMLLTGSANVDQLRRAPIVLGERLRRWDPVKP